MIRFAAILWLGVLACGGDRPARPDLVLVTFDTLRRDHVGVYGGGGHTPNFDAVAARGLVHEAAYTSMPTTGPAHLSLFTGLYPSEHGSRSNGVPLGIARSARSLPARLRSVGYTAAAFVTSALLSPRATGLVGFDVVDAPTQPLRPGADAVEAAIRWLETAPRPYFLWVHLYDPHAPYGRAASKPPRLPLDPALHGWVDRARFLTPDARRRMAARYADGVRDSDDALGALMSGLRTRAPQVVVLVSDHGESLAEHLDARGYAYDHGEFLDPECVAIPLVLAGPGIPAGRSPGTASIRDLYTTLLAAAGLPDEQAEVEGRRDLRSASEARRIVGIERRQFAAPPSDPVRAHGAAAAVFQRVLVVAEDGRPTRDSRPGPDPARLIEIARRHAGLSTVSGPEPVDPETREALRSLGYGD